MLTRETVNLKANTIRQVFKNLLVSLILLGVMCCSSRSSPEESLEDFYKYSGGEETLMDPLILAGDKVVPLVLENIRNKQMPKRRYAIEFLGNGTIRQALPALEELVKNNTEEDFIRGDALQAIYRIDQGLGREIAQKYKDAPALLGGIAKNIIAGSISLERRSYFTSFLAHSF